MRVSEEEPLAQKICRDNQRLNIFFSLFVGPPSIRPWKVICSDTQNRTRQDRPSRQTGKQSRADRVSRQGEQTDQQTPLLSPWIVNEIILSIHPCHDHCFGTLQITPTSGNTSPGEDPLLYNYSLLGCQSIPFFYFFCSLCICLCLRFLFLFSLPSYLSLSAKL